jgi:hypothetical protein
VLLRTRYRLRGMSIWAFVDIFVGSNEGAAGLPICNIPIPFLAQNLRAENGQGSCINELHGQYWDSVTGQQAQFCLEHSEEDTG